MLLHFRGHSHYSSIVLGCTSIIKTFDLYSTHRMYHYARKISRFTSVRASKGVNAAAVAAKGVNGGVSEAAKGVKRRRQ
jgi:hypothetical protein